MGIGYLATGFYKKVTILTPTFPYLIEILSSGHTTTVSPGLLQRNRIIVLFYTILYNTYHDIHTWVIFSNSKLMSYSYHTVV